ncbi:hypothetical protein ACI65C_005439 [Semiaphis heraclei]
MLKDPEVKRQYQIEMDKTIEELTVKNEELDWEAIRNMIVRIAEQNIGVLRRSKNVWYNSKCQKAIEQRKKAREDHLRWGTDESKRIFISERKHISGDDLNRIYKNVICSQKKQIYDQHWIIHTESIKDTDSKKTNTIRNDTEVKQSEHSFNKCSNNQFSTHGSVNLYSLHEPFDLNHIYGLRNRLFKTFNDFSSILENALLPPVLKSYEIKNRYVKEKIDGGSDLMGFLKTVWFDNDSATLIIEIKKESKNEDLHKKNNKTNISLRKLFQIELIRCYKLAINATKNLVQKCKVLENMLEECDYKDTDNDNDIDSNILNVLFNKALSKPKIQSYSANPNRLSMYNKDKPKLGSCHAQGYSKKSVELTRKKVS